MDPREVLRLRSGTVDWLESTRSRAFLEAQIKAAAWPEVATHDPDPALTIASMMAKHACLGPSYFVTREMQRLAFEAAAHLSDGAFRAHFLPSQSGFLLFEETMPGPKEGAAGVRAVSWQPGEEFTFPGETHFVWWGERDSQIEAVGGVDTEAGRVIDELMPPLPVEYTHFNDECMEGMGYLAKMFFEVCLFLKSTIEAERTPLVLHPIEKKYAKKRNVNTSVSIVRLRKVESQERPPAGPCAGERQYTCQWEVGGFYRRYKSGKVGWVRPHIKGPKDKPLRKKEKIFVWDR